MAFRKIEEYDPQATEELAVHYKEVLRLLGEDPEREGLLKTPERVAKSMQFLTQGYHMDGAEILRSAMFKEDYRQMVVVKDIELYSIIARVVECYARRLQVQERLTVQIRDCIQDTLHPLGVGVVIEASHMCMQIRGVQKQNSITTTSAFTGGFLKDERTRSEFMRLIGVSLH